MLFRKDIEPRCAYCAKGNVINDREVACPKRGGVARSTTVCGSNMTPSSGSRPGR